MVFKIFVFAIISLIHACSGGQPKKTGIIGEKLDDTTSLYNAYGFSSQTMFLADAASHRILRLELDELEISASYPLTDAKEEDNGDGKDDDNEHTLLSNYDGSYVIDFSKKHLEVVAANGDREEKPFKFQGEPISAAYNPELGMLVMQDNLQSIGLMTISSKGKITDAWLGGSLIAADKSLLAGDVDKEGRLILATSDKSILIVDVENSIAAKDWDFTSFDSTIEDIYWVAPDHGFENLSLVLAEKTLAIIDVASKTVVEKISLTEKFLKVVNKSKLVKPHVVFTNTNTGRETIYYISDAGALAVHELPDSSLQKISVSFLSEDTEEFSVLINDDESHQVYQLRLSDNLVMVDYEIKSKGEAKLGPDLIFVVKESKLGYLQRYDFRREELKELKGFNLDYFRNK